MQEDAIECTAPSYAPSYAPSCAQMPPSPLMLKVDAGNGRWETRRVSVKHTTMLVLDDGSVIDVGEDPTLSCIEHKVIVRLRASMCVVLVGGGLCGCRPCVGREGLELEL